MKIKHECDARALVLMRAIDGYTRWRDDLNDEAAEVALEGLPRRSFYLNHVAEKMIPQFVQEMRESEMREHKEQIEHFKETGNLTITPAKR